MKLIGIIGGPATGKSTLMKGVLKELNVNPQFGELVKIKDASGNMVALGTHHPTQDVLVLGLYEEGQPFPGTDRLSMSIAPSIPTFLKENADKYRNTRIIFEGARLTSSKFLLAMKEISDIHLFLITAPMDEDMFEDHPAGTVTRKQRMGDRGSNQDETWVAGRDTAASNAFHGVGVVPQKEVLKNFSQEDKARNIKTIVAAMS